MKGRYRLLDVIGEGGMGAVYAAEHLEIGRRVAVKLVHAIHARNPQIAGRLKQEAHATGAIESDNVVQILDAGEDESLGLFVVMELLAGEDLEQRLERERCLSEQDAIWIADQAARGLARAHARGVVHRDLKPANVFLSVREDNATIVKLVDFGIAKLVRDATTVHHGLTQNGCVVGTAQYMSPEQAQGLEVDHRSDVYSLGALIYEMVVGEPPVPDFASYEQKILHIVTKPRPRISESKAVSPELDQLVADMLAMSREVRPQDMVEVRKRLAAITANETRRSGTISLPPAAVAVDIPPIIPTVGDARRLAWGAAVIAGLVMVTAGARVAAAPSDAPTSSRVRAKPAFLVATGIEAATARPRVPTPKPRPVPHWTAPPAAPSVTSRPLGGTGISQEF